MGHFYFIGIDLGMTYLGGPNKFFEMSEDEQATMFAWWEAKTNSDKCVLSPGPISPSGVGYFLSHLGSDKKGKGKKSTTKTMTIEEHFSRGLSAFQK